jgi:hypothetical protein
LARRLELRIGFRPQRSLDGFDALSGEGAAATIKVTAFAGATPVRSIDIEGQAGQIVSSTLEADAVDAVELSPGPASLVDLCYVHVCGL